MNTQGDFGECAVRRTIVPAYLGDGSDLRRVALVEQVIRGSCCVLQQALAAKSTQLAEAEAARVAAEQAKLSTQDFVDKIGHELVTPGHQISMLVSLVTQCLEKGDTGKVHEWLSVIDRSTRQLSRLVGDVLDLSRMRRQAFSLSYDLVNLEELVESAVLQARMVRQRSTAFAVNVPPLLFMADAFRLLQVFDNLLSNAVRHMPDGGMISVDARVLEDRHLLCAVSDTGPGVPSELREALFDEFVQCSAGGCVSGKLGIGLTICREIIALHGGSIWVENREPHGAQFCFTIPLKYLQ